VIQHYREVSCGLKEQLKDAQLAFIMH